MLSSRVSIASRQAALLQSVVLPQSSRHATAAAVGARCSLATFSHTKPATQQTQTLGRCPNSSLLTLSSARASPLVVRAFHLSAIRAAETVKVPQMAESISEGTLKQWNKKKGDFVKQDEEIATIETDKVSLRRS